jgi:hypothetical protein
MADKPEVGGGRSVTSDLFMFLGIFLLFFLIWVAGGGPNRPLSFSGPYLRPITSPGSGAEAYGNPNYPGFTTGITIGGWGATISSGGSGTTTFSGGSSSLSRLVSLIPDSYGPKETDEDREYLTITASAEVSTEGWKLVSQKTGKGAPIPEGAQVPRSGSVNILSPITLKAGESMIVVTGRSPVGVSFKENRCTGYFEERQDFRPPLTQSCPTSYEEYDRFYEDDDDECLSYLATIPYCSTDTDASSAISSSCEDFAEEYLNYAGCVDAHEDDSDFSGRTWRVFLGKSDDLWRKDGETILLLDAGGKLVGSLSY